LSSALTQPLHHDQEESHGSSSPMKTKSEGRHSHSQDLGFEGKKHKKSKKSKEHSDS
jgi:hypothetical protein